jgi:hypothetical protein
MINLLIPKHPDECIYGEVLSSVKIPYRLFVVNSLTERDEPDKLRRILAARQRFSGIQGILSLSYSLLLDSDTVLPESLDDRILDMLSETTKAIGIPYGYVHNDEHVALAAMFIETQLLFDAPFRFPVYPDEQCECQAFCNDVRGLGYAVRYESSFGYCRELR